MLRVVFIVFVPMGVLEVFTVLGSAWILSSEKVILAIWHTAVYQKNNNNNNNNFYLL